MTSLTSALLTYMEEGELRFVKKPWGVMQEVHVPQRDILIKRISIFEGHQTSKQFHASKDELIIVLSGSGQVLMNDAPQHSTFIRILPGTVHRVTGPLEYLEVSTYDPDDVTRLEDDYGRSD